MTVLTQIDHVELGLSRLLSQWADSPEIQGLLKSYLEQSNELETVAFQVLTERGIHEAIGEQLDVIAALFNVSRNGGDDAELRNRILSRITILNTDGTTESFLQVLRVTSGSDFVDFWEHTPGDVHARLGDGYDVYTYTDLQDTVPAGVNLRVYVDDEFDSFIGSEVVQELSDLQTNNGEDIQVTPDGVTLYDLQVKKSVIADNTGNLSILPEIEDIPGNPYLSELLFRNTIVTTGIVVDDLGNTIVDNENNILIWVDYSF